METSKTPSILYSVTLVAPFVILMLGAWVWKLHTELQIEQLRVQDLQEERVPVQVSCVCPAYEDGWDDAEYVEDLDCEGGHDIEDLRLMCVELEEFGYVPDC